MTVEKVRELVEQAGGIFVGCDRSVVQFKATPDGDVLSLYFHAVRSVVDVRLALKDFHEKQRAAMWEAAAS